MQNEETPGSAPSSSSAPKSSSSSALREIAEKFAAQASGEGPVYNDELPIIRWIGGQLPRAVDCAEDALLESDLPLYQRGGYVVRVAQRPATTSRDIERPAGALGIVPVDKPFLQETLTRLAHFESAGRGEKWRTINCPAELALAYLSRRGHWRLLPLLGVISAPTLRPDGSLLARPGYDQRTGLYFDPCGVEFPPIADRPSRDDAAEALKYLRGVFKTFPFVNEDKIAGGGVDEAVFIASVLTALVRRSLDTAPLFGYSATVMESGKSLLANCVSLITSGVGPTIMRYPETNEEAAKLAISVLLQNEAVVLIDNVDRPVEGDWLCIILSEDKYSARVMAKLETVEAPTNVTVIVTGNNLVFAGDVRTRALLSRLDPDCEHPADRTFDVDLRDWIPLHRQELVAAALTIMRAWQVNPTLELDGRDLCTPWDRYKRWSNMVRTPLLWLGMADPCDSLKLLEKEDPKRNTLLRLLKQWDARYGATTNEPVPRRLKAADVISEFMRQAASTPDAPEVADFREVLYQVAGDRSGELRAPKLAGYLRSNVGRIVDGLKVVNVGEDRGTTLWSVWRSGRA